MRYPGRLLTDDLKRAPSRARDASTAGSWSSTSRARWTSIAAQLPSLLRRRPRRPGRGLQPPSRRPGRRANAWVLADRGAVATGWPVGQRRQRRRRSGAALGALAGAGRRAGRVGDRRPGHRRPRPPRRGAHGPVRASWCASHRIRLVRDLAGMRPGAAAPGGPSSARRPGRFRSGGPQTPGNQAGSDDTASVA